MKAPWQYLDDNTKQKALEIYGSEQGYEASRGCGGRTPRAGQFSPFLMGFGGSGATGNAESIKDGFDPTKIPQTPTPEAGTSFTPNKDWLTKFLPQDLGYMDNLFKTQVADTTQKGDNAIGAMEGAMNKVGNINQTYGLGYLPQARDEMMSGLKEATEGYGGYMDRALGLMGDKSSEYMDNIFKGTVPVETDAMLRKMQENSMANAERTIQKNTNALGKGWLENMGGKGMIDSTRFTNGVSDITGRANSELMAANNNLENQFLNARLNLPFQIMEAGMKPVYQQAGMMESGGRTLADLLGKEATSAFGSAEAVYKDLLTGALEEGKMPMQYQDMINKMPEWAFQGQQGYMDNMMKIWNMLLQKDIADRNASIQEDANDWDFGDFLFG